MVDILTFVSSTCTMYPSRHPLHHYRPMAVMEAVKPEAEDPKPEPTLLTASSKPALQGERRLLGQEARRIRTGLHASRRHLAS
jgi:hypothetical protein